MAGECFKLKENTNKRRMASVLDVSCKCLKNIRFRSSTHKVCTPKTERSRQMWVKMSIFSYLLFTKIGCILMNRLYKLYCKYQHIAICFCCLMLKDAEA